jgi:RNA 3'-terminal phosphate cyclase (ATP)
LTGSPSQVEVVGGTHVRWSPSFEYLDWHWRHFVNRMGVEVDFSLDRAGYFPRGGGQVRAAVRPGSDLSALDLRQRGALRSIRGVSTVSNLPSSIADRQRRQALRRLSGLEVPCSILQKGDMPSNGKGTALTLLAEFDASQVCCFGLGERGKPAERVADEAVDQLLAFLESDAVVDKYLADQLLLPLALAEGASQMLVSEVTQHLLTNAEVLRTFGAARIEVNAGLGKPGLVHILPQR